MKIMEFEKKKEVKILVVDDVEVNVIILEEIIQNMGYEPLAATSVKEALELMQNEKILPQIILTDISMPDIDGYEFCTILKRDPYTKDIPVIFISAMDSTADRTKGFELGAVDYIAKPFERAEVEMRIDTHLKLYTLQRELEENNKRLSLVVTKQMEKLRIEQKNIMLALARLIENKECVSGNHHSNIAHNSRILAQAMQMAPMHEHLMTENFIDTIESAAGLHDIGKIMIPDSIILKKGPLTEEESAIMKTDIKEKKDKYIIEMDLPGYEKENINLSLKDGYLEVTAEVNKEDENEEKDKFVHKERYYGHCSRSFYVGEQIKEEDVNAEFKNGILKICIPKKEERKELPEAKHIEIK